MYTYAEFKWCICSTRSSSTVDTIDELVLTAYSCSCILFLYIRVEYTLLAQAQYCMKDLANQDTRLREFDISSELKMRYARYVNLTSLLLHSKLTTRLFHKVHLHLRAWLKTSHHHLYQPNRYSSVLLLSYTLFCSTSHGRPYPSLFLTLHLCI